MHCVGEDIGRLDARLSTLAREEASLQLRVGQSLEVLRRGGFAELGFSSLSAYVLERCDRSVRWAEVARCLARRVEVLPELRRAMAAGQISWSMAELLARVARPDDEGGWLEAAESRTVRQMRVLVAEAMARRAASAVDAVMEDDAEGARGSAGALGAHEGTCAHGAGSPHGAAGEREGGANDDDSDHSGDESRETPSECGEWVGSDGSDGDDGAQDSEMVTLTCTVDQEEAWLFEATRLLLAQMGVKGTESQGEALLAEGLGTLQAMLPEGVLDLQRLHGSDVAQQRWARELARWRVEAEVLCEDRFCGLLWSKRDQRFRLDPVDGSSVRERVRPSESQEASAHRVAEPRGAVAVAAARGMEALEHLEWVALDRYVRALSRALAQHELEVSQLVLLFHRANGWRRLGYATEAQYARERLGWSVSSLRGRRSLALRLEKLPRVAAALGAGQIGVEAALQVVRVATGSTEAAWVERARRRTVKHLREEVVAARVALRHSGEVDCLPPSDAEMEAFQQLEQAVVGGRVCQGEAARVANDTGEEEIGSSATEKRLVEPSCRTRRAWYEMLGSLATWLEAGLQLSAGAVGERSAAARRGASAGRVTLRLRMSRSTCSWWRGLASQARRWLPHGMSWLRFLCLSMWQAWRHLHAADVAYSPIYVRDCYRCRSPVCSRRDVTPHHIRFRSAGGSDAPVNIGSVCTWCHLEGVHGGRLRATGTARLIHWEIGAGTPCLVVHGRERQVA